MRRVVNEVAGLTRDRVVEEAMRIADEGGLEAVSLRRIARNLGVTPMALYHYVHSKDEVLDLMADRLLGELDLSGAAVGPWPDALTRMGESFLRVVAAHPAAPLLLSRPFDSPAAHRLAETILEILGRGGFAPTRAVQLLQVLTGMLLGPAIHRSTYAAAASRSTQTTSTSTVRKSTSPPARYEVPWISGEEADRLTIDLWVAAVRGLASEQRRTRRGGR